MNHTKEPWEFGDIYSYGIGFIYGAGIEVAETNGNSLEEINANAKRIVACVNACARITNEELASNPIYDIKDPFVHDLQQKIKMLEVRIERLNRILTVNGISVQ